MTPFPWEQAMQFGFGILHLSSEAFWSLSVRELDAAMQAHTPPQATPNRDAFTALQRLYPDMRELHDGP